MALLGIAPGTPLERDQVRRHYMRKLRVHSPERDPEGFRRLRDAYELIQSLLGHVDAVQLVREEEESRPESDRPQPDPKQAVPPAPDVAESLSALLAAIEREDFVAASSLLNLCKEQIADARRELRQDVLARWAFTRELIAVGRALPSPLVKAIARGIACGDFETVRPEVEAYRKAHWGLAQDANRFLARNAPSLHRELGRMLAPASRRGLRIPRLAWYGLFLAFAIARGVMPTCDDERKHTETRHYTATTAMTSRALAAVRELQQHEHTSRDQRALASLIESAVSRDRGSCVDLAQLVGQLRRASDPHYPECIELLERLAAETSKMCPTTDFDWQR